MDFIVIDSAAVDVIVADRFLQSSEFEAGYALQEFLIGNVKTININPNIRINKDKNGIYILGVGDNGGNLLIVDLINSPLGEFIHDDDMLFVIQRMLRLAIRCWKNYKPAVSERIIPNSTKIVLFPFPFKSQTSFRIAFEREPDKKRLEKRDRVGRYLLAYKCGVSEGGGGSEVAEVTVFRKALAGLADARKKIASINASEEAVGGVSKALKVTQVGKEEASSSLSPYQGYDIWVQLLTQAQRKFVESALDAPHRIEGPAGTGKSLCLVLKAIHGLRQAEEKSQQNRSLFITPSESTRQSIKLSFEANDNSKFFEKDPYSSPQSLTITTLHELCGNLLNTKIAETEFLDRDAMDSKFLQLFYIEESLETSRSIEFSTHKKFLSKKFREFIEREDTLSISELLQHEISVLIKGRAKESLELYRTLPNLKYGLPVETESDRGFVYVIYKKYQSKLQEAGQFDTDDVVLSAIGQLDTPIWRRRRVTEGYDAVYIDETHLFNMNELSILHYLTKREGPYPIAYSVDRSQALGDRGWGGGTITEAINPSKEKPDTEHKSIIQSVFRCSKEVVDLAFSVTSAGATLFTNFDDPMKLARSGFTEAEERKCADPVYLKYPNDDAMIEGAFGQAQRMADAMDVSKGDVLIVAFDKETLDRLTSLAEIKNKPIKIIRKRGDVELINQAKSLGQFVMGHVDYVGGLEFSGAILVGVDDGRVPPVRNENREESKNFLSYASHNRLYVAITRAKFRIELLGVDSRGPSALLMAAINSRILQVENAK
jgi:hypothetical protein